MPTRHLAAIDDRVSFAQAAALPIAGLTALRALRVGGAVLGRSLPATGATGGVGQFAVQLAVAAGAHVTAQVSGPGREAEARALGAHQVVTSLEDDGLGPFHLVLDGIGGPLTAQAVRRIAPGGHLAWYGNIRGAAELRLADFYAQGWNAHIVGFISPVPQETKGRGSGDPRRPRRRRTAQLPHRSRRRRGEDPRNARRPAGHPRQGRPHRGGRPVTPRRADRP